MKTELTDRAIITSTHPKTRSSIFKVIKDELKLDNYSNSSFEVILRNRMDQIYKTLQEINPYP